MLSKSNDYVYLVDTFIIEFYRLSRLFTMYLSLIFEASKLGQKKH